MIPPPCNLCITFAYFLALFTCLTAGLLDSTDSSNNSDNSTPTPRELKVCSRSHPELSRLHCPAFDQATFNQTAEWNLAHSPSVSHCDQLTKQHIRFPAYEDGTSYLGGSNQLEIINHTTIGGPGCETSLRFSFHAQYGDITNAMVSVSSKDKSRKSAVFQVEYDASSDKCECTNGCDDIAEFECKDEYQHVPGVDVIGISVSLCVLLEGNMNCCGFPTTKDQELHYFQSAFTASDATATHSALQLSEGRFANFNPFDHGCIQYGLPPTISPAPTPPSSTPTAKPDCNGVYETHLYQFISAKDDATAQVVP